MRILSQLVLQAMRADVLVSSNMDTMYFRHMVRNLFDGGGMLMSRHVQIGRFHFNVVPNRSQRRVVFRAWWLRSSCRSGGWLLASVRPLRLLCGRDIAPESLL